MQAQPPPRPPTYVEGRAGRVTGGLKALLQGQVPSPSHIRPRPVAGSLLQALTDGGDPARVEAQPVHSADVACVLDLEAAVHDYGHAAVLADARPFLLDHPDLPPQYPAP